MPGSSSRLGRVVVDLAVAAALSAFATILTMGLREITDLGIFIFYVAVVTIAAWYRGRFCALVTVLLSTLALNFTFLSPLGTILPAARGDALGVLAYIITGTLVALMTSGLRHARTSAEERAEVFKTQADELARAKTESELALSDRRLSEERESFLLHASTILGSSLDYESTLQNVAQLAVPRLADWCGVLIQDEDGQIRSVAVAHADPGKVEFARAFQKKYPVSPDDPSGAPNVIRTGKTEYVLEVTDDMLVHAAKDSTHLADIRALKLRSAVTAPLTVGGRTLGALSLIGEESGRQLTPADVSLAEELGRRAAVAIDNARRFRAAERARAAAERNADRIARLQRVTAALATALTARGIADAVITQGLSAFDADQAVLALLQPDSKTLEIVRSIGLRDEVEREYHYFSVDASTPLSEAVRTAQPVFFASRAEMTTHYPDLIDSGNVDALAWAAMPLVVEGTVIGGIALGFRNEHPFSNEDREFAMALARQSAQALERARLHDAEQSIRAEAEEARRRAEEANRAKSQFLATMSHELRTPLNAIAGYVQLLELGIHGPVPQEQLDILARVRRSQRILLSLIDDILSFARLESGKVEYRYETIAVAESLRAAHDLLAPQLAERGLNFELLCTDPATQVWADREKFVQIVVNLLSNAVKFTDKGGSVTVTCSTSGNSLLINITDTGSGIPADKLEVIFEPFVQAESGLTRRIEGSGLGLAISRDLARAMQGDLTVKSEVGKGSTFTLWLPATKPDSKPDDDQGPSLRYFSS